MKFTASPSRASHIRVFDMTPMIDVVLQLIIFFMFTSQFGELVRTDIALPLERGQQADLPFKPSLIVDIDENGQYLIASEPVTLNALMQMARAEIISNGGQASSVLVQVRPDRLSPAGHLNRLTRELAQLGIRNWSMAAFDPAGAPEQDWGDAP